MPVQISGRFSFRISFRGFFYKIKQVPISTSFYFNNMDILGVLDSDGHCIRYIVLSFNDSLELSKINILSFSVPGTSMGAVGILSDQSF